MKLSTKKYSSKFLFAAQIQNMMKSDHVDIMFMKMYSNDLDIDTVIINPQNYSVAINLLQQSGWRLRNNKSKIRERDKDFFVHPQSSLMIHLHKYYSWNTVQYLDSFLVWKRKRQENNVFLPSFEDELLIIGAHSLFENMCIVPDELKYGKKLLKQNIDWSYVRRHARIFHWELAIPTIVGKLNKSESKLSFIELLHVRLYKMLQDIVSGKFSLLHHELFAYLLIDWAWCYPKRNKKLYDTP